MDRPAGGAEREPPPLDPTEVRRILGRIEDVVRERHVVLVGGQAVVVWLAQLQDRLRGDMTAKQVVSRDLDLLGGAADARRASELLGGRVRLSRSEDRTPLAGVTMFLDGNGIERRLDVMHRIHGMRSDDIRKTAIEVDVRLDDGREVPIWVMHPERCMESRVHNSTLANKQTELAWTQLRASILCARAFSHLLLDEHAPIRDVLKLNERIFRLARSDLSRRLAVEHGIEVLDAILADERLPGRFNTIRLPQMREQIRSLRAS